jgi:phenylacetate-CoA ligase
MPNHANGAMVAIHLAQTLAGQLPAPLLARWQQRRLRRIIAYAQARSPFYAERHRGIDWGNRGIEALPPIDKSEAMAHFDALVTDPRLRLEEIQGWLEEPRNRGRRYLDRYTLMHTSGTTGAPMVVVHDDAGMHWIHNAFVTRQTAPAWRRHLGLLQGLLGRPVRLATLVLTQGAYPATGAVSFRTPAQERFVQRRVISSEQPLADMVKELNEFQPDQVLTYAGVIELLAEEQLAGRLRLGFDHPLRAVVSMSELLTERARRLALEAWGVAVEDTYAAAECLAMGRTCRHGRMHLFSDMCLLEAVDHRNRPLPPGEPGERVLITNLFNRVQPLIRYALPDVTGLAGESCPCGSPFPTLLPIQGRSGEVFHFLAPDGSEARVAPGYLLRECYALECLRDYQIRQTTADQITACFVAGPEGPEHAAEKLRTALEEGLRAAGLQRLPELRVIPVTAIPRHPVSGKRQLMVGMNTLSGNLP